MRTRHPDRLAEAAVANDTRILTREHPVEPGARTRVTAPAAYNQPEDGELRVLREGEPRELRDGRLLVKDTSGRDRAMAVSMVTGPEVRAGGDPEAGSGALMARRDAALPRWSLICFLSLLCTVLASSPSVAEAETEAPVVVELLSGEVVRGDIVEHTEEYLVVDRGGGRGPLYDPRRRIRRDEIKSIQSLAEWERDHTRELAGPPYWRWSTATGYAALGGVGLGALIMSAEASTPGAGGGVLAGALLGTALGAGSGWVIGASADRKIAAGEPVGRRHRNAVRAGTMFVGGGVGFLAGVLQISDQGDSGRDQEILLNSTVVGLAAGALIQVLLDSKLGSTPLEPAIAVSRTGHAMVGVTIPLGRKRHHSDSPRYSLPPVDPVAPENLVLVH